MKNKDLYSLVAVLISVLLMFIVISVKDCKLHNAAFNNGCEQKLVGDKVIYVKPQRVDTIFDTVYCDKDSTKYNNKQKEN